MICGKKKENKALCGCGEPQAPIRFLAKGHLARVSGQSHLSDNGKGDDEMIPGAVHISPSICVWLRKTLKNLS